jgi:hypothetical protein
MDQSKDNIDFWIEETVYSFFEACMQRGSSPSAEEAASIEPFLRMYQAIQARTLIAEIDHFWDINKSFKGRSK